MFDFLKRKKTKPDQAITIAAESAEVAAEDLAHVAADAAVTPELSQLLTDVAKSSHEKEIATYAYKSLRQGLVDEVAHAQLNPDAMQNAQFRKNIEWEIDNYCKGKLTIDQMKESLKHMAQSLDINLDVAKITNALSPEKLLHLPELSQQLELANSTHKGLEISIEKALELPKDTSVRVTNSGFYFEAENHTGHKAFSIPADKFNAEAIHEFKDQSLLAGGSFDKLAEVASYPALETCFKPYDYNEIQAAAHAKITDVILNEGKAEAVLASGAHIAAEEAETGIFKRVGSGIGSGFSKTTEGIKSATTYVGDGLSSGYKATKNGIKSGVSYVGGGINNVANGLGVGSSGDYVSSKVAEPKTFSEQVTKTFEHAGIEGKTVKVAGTALGATMVLDGMHRSLNSDVQTTWVDRVTGGAETAAGTGLSYISLTHGKTH